MQEKEPKKQTFWEKNVGYVIFFGLIGIIVLYVLYGIYFEDNSNAPDCYYTDGGCQGDNRFGQ